MTPVPKRANSPEIERLREALTVAAIALREIQRQIAQSPRKDAMATALEMERILNEVLADEETAHS